MPRFKVGDRVRIANIERDRDAKYLGDIVTITTLPAAGKQYYVAENHRPWYERELEYAPPIVEPVEFKKGDEVFTERYSETATHELEVGFLPKQMGRYVGLAGHITAVEQKRGGKVYQVHGWWWPVAALRRSPQALAEGDRVRLLAYTLSESAYAACSPLKDDDDKQAVVGCTANVKAVEDHGSFIPDCRVGYWPTCAVEILPPLETPEQAAARLGLAVGDVVECIDNGVWGHAGCYPDAHKQVGYRGKIREIYMNTTHNTPVADVGNGEYQWPLTALAHVPVLTTERRSLQTLTFSHERNGMVETITINGPLEVTFTH